jgi:methylmalonyl-CoA mutase cobalamin-binding subunit
MIVRTGEGSEGARSAEQLAIRLSTVGIESIHFDAEQDPLEIAAAAVREQADSIELCLPTDGRAVPLLRDLLRELIALGRRDVSIVMHRVS